MDLVAARFFVLVLIAASVWFCCYMELASQPYPRGARQRQEAAL